MRFRKTGILATKLKDSQTFQMLLTFQSISIMFDRDFVIHKAPHEKEVEVI
jgi:hypothetical protein